MDYCNKVNHYENVYLKKVEDSLVVGTKQAAWMVEVEQASALKQIFFFLILVV